MSEYTHKTEDLKYIKSIDLNIASKVTRTQRNEKPEKIDLFDEYQIKWFNQQSEEDLIEYFESVIEFFKTQEDFLYSAKNTIEIEKDLSNGLNYPIILSGHYDEMNEWYEYGYANKYPEAVYRELQRVVKLYDSKVIKEMIEERV